MNRYNLPIFGADLVSLPGVHLICIDLQPAYASQSLSKRGNDLLKAAQRCRVLAVRAFVEREGGEG